ncbi:centrosomal protein of 89 kDa isoform X2 [Cephus cinctus]|uniref:Centrosomal protein of 89 kDa isoform X2 n=1 Tax=Cephus cinctus TaxID=211228 RepID=A0AAJ7FKD5_CEPCN|nr:centrosomal protein of 89 kDa isoform X2 [Cephus cinctus]
MVRLLRIFTVVWRPRDAAEIDESRDRNERKVSSKDLEPVHGTRHRRKHISKSRYTMTNENPPGVQVGCGQEIKSHCHTEKVDVREKEVSTGKLERSLGDSAGSSDEKKEKDIILSKVRSKYRKLERNCQEVKAERDRLAVLLEEREGQFRQLHLHHEDLTEMAERVEFERRNVLELNAKLRAENAQLNEDVMLLKSLVYHLNVELERYQDKLRMSNQAVQPESVIDTMEGIDSGTEDKKVSGSWERVDLHALGPLLEAYRENLGEKERLLRVYTEEMDRFSGRSKEVVAENECLHAEIEDLRLKCNNLEEDGRLIEKESSAIKEEKELLVKQASLQRQKLQELHAVYERKVESMSEDNNKLHKEYLGCKTELSNLQGKYEVLSDAYEKSKKNSERSVPASVHTAAVDECRHLLEELKYRYENERKSLQAKVKHLEESQPENEKQLLLVTQERDQLRNSVKTLERNLKRSQRRLERFQNAIYSVHVSRDSLKRQLNTTTTYCRELEKEQEKLLAERQQLVALLEERERENEEIQHLGDNITQRMGNLKTELKIVQRGAKEQLATVEKHIKNQELGADRVRADYQSELQRLKQLLRQKEDLIGNLQREKCTTRENLELVWRAATSDDRKVKDALRNTKIYNI